MAYRCREGVTVFPDELLRAAAQLDAGIAGEYIKRGLDPGIVAYLLAGINVRIKDSLGQFCKGNCGGQCYARLHGGGPYVTGLVLDIVTADLLSED